MRISNQGFINTIKRNLAAPSDEMGRLYAQTSSGKRLQKLSDDPQALVRALGAHASLKDLAARRTVAQQGQELLSVTDGALGQITESLSQAKSLVLRTANSSLGESERAALAQQVRSLQPKLVLAGNASAEGHYVFSGTRTDAAPLQETAAGVSYLGNYTEVEYQVSPDQRTSVGLTGAEVFNYPDGSGQRAVTGVDQDIFTTLTEVAAAIETGDTQQLEQLAGDLDKLHVHTVNLRGEAGVLAQQWGETLSAADDTSILLNQVLANEESVDYTSAIVELSNLQTAYQAGLSLTSQMLRMPNLFDQP
jgi:flagellar hook-associated protein 3 FlgL